MKKLVAFDLDGTLAQSNLHLMPAYELALKRMGKALLPKTTLLNLIGGSAEDNRAIIVPNGTMEEFRLFERYVVEVVDATIGEVGRAYAHIAESLTELRRLGYTIVLCSNGPLSYSGLVLASLGIKELFDEIPESQDGWDKARLLSYILEKYHPQGAVMVGDRHFDKSAAEANKIPFIGASYGLFPDEVAQADIVIRDAGELPAAIAKLIG